jgi:protein disulfide-isomerase-like protein
MDNNYKKKYIKYKLKYTNLCKSLKEKSLIKFDSNDINDNAFNMSGGGILDKNDKLVLFKAEWCGHCKKFVPIWDNLKQKYENNSNIELVTFDSDKNKLEQLLYKIEGFPTLILNKKGKHIEYTGKRTEEDINNFLSKNINL